MDEIKTAKTHKRHIWIAVMLSLVMPGLGQVYCGRLVRGLVLNFLNILPLPIIIALFSSSNSPMSVQITLLLILAGGLVQLIAIIDSAWLAKQAAQYELKDYNRWYVYALLVLIVSGGAVGSGLYLRDRGLEAFMVPAASCYPTIVPRDRILANKSACRANDPKRGDLVVFINPENRRQNYIKRVVAVAGDRVEMRDNQLYVNGQMLKRQPLLPTELGASKINVHDSNFQGDVFYEMNGGSKYKIFLSKMPADKKMQSFPEMTVPKYNCFVLGDNRNNSYDSRNYGPVPVASIKGRADWLYWPLSRFGRLN